MSNSDTALNCSIVPGGGLNDPARWEHLDWFDLHSGSRFRITTRGDSGGLGVALVKTYRDVVGEYRVHPEAKSCGPDGAVCHRATIGLLARRHVVAGVLPELIGKEANKLEDVEAGLVHAEAEVLNIYEPRFCACGCASVLTPGRAQHVDVAHRMRAHRARNKGS